MFIAVPLDSFDFALSLLNRAGLFWHWAGLIRSVLQHVSIIDSLTWSVVRVVRYIWLALSVGSLLTLERVAYVRFLKLLGALRSF